MTNFFFTVNVFPLFFLFYLRYSFAQSQKSCSCFDARREEENQIRNAIKLFELCDENALQHFEIFQLCACVHRRNSFAYHFAMTMRHDEQIDIEIKRGEMERKPEQKRNDGARKNLSFGKLMIGKYASKLPAVIHSLLAGIFCYKLIVIICNYSNKMCHRLENWPYENGRKLSVAAEAHQIT